MNEHARNMMEAFAHDLARRSGVPEPGRSEARDEMVSHLWDRARSLAAGGDPGPEHVHAAIEGSGGRPALEQTFFGSLRAAMPPSRWGRRLAAYAVDAVILAFVLSALVTAFQFTVSNPCDDTEASECLYSVRALPCLGITSSEASMTWTEDDLPSGGGSVGGAVSAGGAPSGVAAWVCFTALQVSQIAYFGLLEGAWGTTLGKMALGIRTQQQDGTRLGWGRAFGRNVTKVQPLFLLLDWIVGMSVLRGQHKRLSDQAAGTRVVASR